MMRLTKRLGIAVLAAGTFADCAKKSPMGQPTPPPQVLVPPVPSSPAPIVLRPVHVRNLAGPKSLYLPHPKTMPGALDPRVTQATIHTTMCESAYIDTVRPSMAYTDPIKDKMLADLH